MQVCYLNSNETIATVAPATDKPYDVYPLEPMCGPDQSSGASMSIIGDVLVICAQVIVSVQMVYEEKVLSRYAIAPLQAIGWEGTLALYHVLYTDLYKW